MAGSTAEAAPLADVPAKHWAAPAVHRIVGEKIMTGETDGKFHGNQPVTRYELAVTLDRFVRYIEAGRKPLHPTSTHAAIPLSSGANPAVKAAFKHLTAGGFIPAKSFLLQGKGTELVTAAQLADALSQVTVRLSDRSLPPNTE